MAMSLDGFVAGPNQNQENPLGEGGLKLHEWAFSTKTFAAMTGSADGETGVDDDVLREQFNNVGASIMGRNMFGPIRGDWGDHSWTGWWGDNPPFHHPVFVLTHHARDPIPLKGGTTFYFVTDGLDSAVAQARKAAGTKDISVGGGASVVRQCLSAGLLDEMQIHLVPLFLGGGERIFEGFDAKKLHLKPIRVLEGKGVTHLKYQFQK